MGRTDRASLLVHVSTAEAFAALTDRDALLAWLPPAGMRGRFDRFDMRTGGSYRLVLTYADTSGSPGKTTADSDVSEVRVVEVVPGERVVQEVEFASDDPAFRGTMRMEWRLRPAEDGTEVEVVARDVPPGVRARDHAEGILSSLAQLAAHLEP
ncbi:SRPBCC domain-containing protein [Cellulomonas sp. GbtcB1]|uniref:SRPBCC domain-containing protein n=1 Tax=Cellulomonas sp. GbtcB1 TaxID=2824746 RepID=UPI001C2FC9E0|nr:SRPBCC domain-containing protein [Cellulomonas sp. GbtcB1]